MSDKTIKKSYYAIIPADVRYSKKVADGGKLLYGEITALCNSLGYCWASNEYFADLYGNDKRTIQRWIKSLEAEGFIWCEVKGTTRKIFIAHKITDFNTEGLEAPEIEEVEEVKPKKKKAAKKEKQETVKYTDQDLFLAEYLLSRIIYNYPDFHNNKKVKVAEWADEIRKLREIDKATHEQIFFMITWIQGGTVETPGKPPRNFEPNDFWSKNILSAKKLRKQWYDNLVPQLQADLKKKVKKHGVTDMAKPSAPQHTTQAVTQM